MRFLTAFLVLAVLTLCACSKPQAVESASVAISGALVTENESSVIAEEPAKQEEPAKLEEPTQTAKAPESSYIQELALRHANELGLKVADGESAIRTAYRYMVETIYFADPVGLDVWRYFSGGREAVPYIENRSISPFLFKIGSCEDFAAATVMLLESAGFEAKYVAGYTISVDGVYIDHAWAVVKLGGEWYHLDPQLEQNVIKNNLLTYRYYLKSDEDMQSDHKWGENLIAYWSDMPEAEKENIRNNYLVPECRESFSLPEPESVRKPQKPNMADIEFEIKSIKKQSGKAELPPIMLNVEPPVLVRERHVTPLLLPRQSELFETAENILSGLPQSATEFERALFIHDYLAKNVEYDREAVGRSSGDAYGAIIDRLANCDGYAKAFELLCIQAGLEVMYISGTSARGAEHAWNAVRVDGLWYYADVTWDRPLRDGDGVYHDYFLLSLDEMSEDHVPDKEQKLELPRSNGGQGYYERMGYFVKDGSDRTADLARAFFRQLESMDGFSATSEHVFLEVKVLAGKQNYFEFKEHYIKNAFNILKEMQTLARERGSAFKVIADASVRCNFNDTTQVLTFYPKIQRLD